MENVTHVLIMAFSAVLFCLGLALLFTYINNYREVTDAVRDSHTVEYTVSDKGDGAERSLVVTGADVYAQYAEYKAGRLPYRIAVETATNEYSSVAGANGRMVCPGGVRPEAEYVQQVIYSGDGDIMMVIYREK